MSEPVTIHRIDVDAGPGLRVVENERGDLSLIQGEDAVQLTPAMLGPLIALLEDMSKAKQAGHVLESGTCVRETEDGTEFELPLGTGSILVQPRDKGGDIPLVIDGGVYVYLPATDLDRFVLALRDAAE